MEGPHQREQVHHLVVGVILGGLERADEVAAVDRDRVGGVLVSPAFGELELEVGPASDETTGRWAIPCPATKPAVDPVGVAAEVDELVTLARPSPYLGSDRRVSPKERSRWRFTDRLPGSKAEDLLDRIAAHPALDGTELALPGSARLPAQGAR